MAKTKVKGKKSRPKARKMAVKKPTIKKPAKKAAQKRIMAAKIKETAAVSTEKPVGKVFSFYTQISVAAVDLNGQLNIGDKVHFKGATTDFMQNVESMQIEGKNVATAGAGDQIGIKVKDRVRPNDIVYKC